MIIPITNKSKNFYSHTGKVFGSREVERKTKDRFYDDGDKTWYLYYKNGSPDAYVSIKNNSIKNIWADDRKHLVEVLKKIKRDIGKSIVTNYFIDEYKKAGYKILDETSKNFIMIKGDYDEEN